MRRELSPGAASHRREANFGRYPRLRTAKVGLSAGGGWREANFGRYPRLRAAKVGLSAGGESAVAKGLSDSNGRLCLLMTDDALERFSPATATWFRGSFNAPTAAQKGAWEAISSGRHALVVAPTGSGKTLSAFLWALDRLASGELPAPPQQRCRALYVTPLKA